jgi:tRNA nucleotidyltransferase (CCA-adding enzyme)
MEGIMELNNILEQIYPDEGQINCLSGIVSSMGNILKKGSNYLKVKKVTPAGSLGKKTILRNHLEVDCVYILEHNGYSYSNNFWEVQRALRENLPQGTQFKINPHSISFSLNKKIGCVSIDLLPAYEINSPSQMQDVKNRDAYYGSTSLLQKKYIKNVVQNYPRFNDLVRLLKLWRIVQEIPMSSYMLELVAANAIYNTRKDQQFPFFLEMCFRTIQSFTDGRAIIPVYWDDYFDNADINCNYSRNGLWIIDPSDPSENIAENISDEERHYINSEAINGVNNMHNNKYEFLYK